MNPKMKPFFKKALWTFGFAVSALLACSFYIYKNTARILIFHTNDIHGWIMPQQVKAQGSKEKDSKELVGGFAALANLLKKDARGYLLIDSGDFFQGTPEGDLTKGDASIECMNALGYTASTLGNHEYDQGKQNVMRLASIAKFPLLCANLYDEKTYKRISGIPPYLIKEIDGVRVAVVGLISSQMKNLSFPKNISGLYFERETDAMQKLMDELKSEGVQVVIVAAHVGIETKESPANFEGEKYLAANVPGIHIILGGHTHFGLERAYQDEKNKTLIVHNQSGLKTVTRTILRVWKKSGKLFCYSHKLVPLQVAKYGEDPELKKIVDSYRKKVGEKLDIVIGKSKMALDNKGIETLLGNWQTDMIRSLTKSDLAFQNVGGIRADLPEGPLTLRHLYLLSPFDNTIVTMRLTGAQIKGILEQSVSGPQGILQVSGVKMSFDKSKPKGEMVSEVTVNGEPLDPKKNYKVATNNFVAAGGDGFVTFKDGKNIEDTRMTLRDLEVEFIKKHSPISSKIEGRIVNLSSTQSSSALKKP